jgi:hypothetical protein
VFSSQAWHTKSVRIWFVVLLYLNSFHGTWGHCDTTTVPIW